MDVPIPEILQTPMEVDEMIMTGAGPSNYHPRIRHAMSLPVLGHLHPKTFKIMDDIKIGVNYLLQTNNSYTFCISGPGHAAIECAFVNLVEDNDIVVIGSSGYWGIRAEDIAKRLNADVKVINKELGEQIELEETRIFFEQYHPKVFFLTHGESSTGMLQQNLEQFGNLCQEFNCLFVVDCVITVGCTPVYVDKWNIDVAFMGTQKVLNAPPGISPITFSARALDKIAKRKTPVKSYNLDAVNLGEYWNSGNRPRIYHHTVCSTLLYGLREAIAIFIENGGLEASWKNHENVAKHFYTLLEKNGLELFITDPKNRVPSVTAIKVPENIDANEIIKHSMNEYNVEISGGIGPMLGVVLRVGLMGINCNEKVAECVAKILIEAIKKMKEE
ncbi:hypothetical protein PVAND_017490 [Polypedilum vanderplanki]|uniref:Alanine--glyoxylate aminotransferase n=1 Tax=Polypedilum vanderplanki TaxID=319348 RepID=A0A9J6BIF9_POLVA|nr:hypothetical protein PVAND_017490 [Polypedilum vanderplanki]